MPDSPVGECLARLPVIVRLLERIAPGDVVLIGGLARSGKSTLAGVVTELLQSRGFTARIVAMDRWIVPAAQRAREGVEHRYDTALMVRTLAPWLAGASALRVRLPVYDRVTRTRTEDDHDFELAPTAVLVLEGVLALAPGIGAGGRMVHRVYVTADETARKWRVIDDLVARGVAGPDEAVHIYEDRERDESPVVRETKPTAEYVVCLASRVGDE